MKRLLALYYHFKPIIPKRMQIALRRWIALRKREANKVTWPINLASAEPPKGWNGWPEKKKFALVLSHDVESGLGYSRCRKLMEVEERLGFRSSFNFVADSYQMNDELRLSLENAGFEVGIHGLKHDGKLFCSRAIFDERVPRINSYLKKWGAVGFRAPAMHHNLEWIADLDIEYDCSTFDTDPFEPQPDGLGTVFPLLFTNKAGIRSYVEIPYTLPQDHSLFVILREKSIEIWKEKLDWIAEKGGLAFLNSHPDYMNFNGTRGRLEEYPIDHYIKFLEYIKGHYAGHYWHVLPRDLARFWKTAQLERAGSEIGRAETAQSMVPGENFGEKEKAAVSGVKIWIDLDNTPHVPFFLPVIRELKSHGHEVFLTARDAFQVCELAERAELSFKKIGRHYGRNKLKKLLGLLWRSVQLVPFYLHYRPHMGLALGSRSQFLLCNVFKVPTVHVMDYEYTRHLRPSRSGWKIMPQALSQIKFNWKPDHIRYYTGIKEDVYVPDFKPDSSILEELGLSLDNIIVTVRPPADEAHYHNPEAEELLQELLIRIWRTPGIQAVLLPRNSRQGVAIRKSHPEWFEDSRIIVPPHAVNGLNLLWFSDLAVSGGGTMNREAAAMGIPVYSIFRGKTGAVDLMLEKEGRLTMIHNVDEVKTKIHFERRDKSRLPNNNPRAARMEVVDFIEEIMRIEGILP